jgi:dTDP-4-amino-4,6-dideoxygalactose transaminase
MSELHAAVALASFRGLDRHMDSRVELVDRFAKSVADVDGLRVIRPTEGDRSTYKDLTIVVESSAFGLTAAELQRALSAEGIDSRRYYSPPIHRQQAYEGRWPNARPLPVTDEMAASVLSPPLWSHLSDDQIDAVADAIVRIQEHSDEVSGALRSAGG